MKTARGLTLVEVLVAIALLGILMAAILPVFTGNMMSNQVSESRTQANLAISTVFDQMRSQSIAALPQSGSQVKETVVNGQAYKVNITYCRVSTYCSATSRMITAEVKNGAKVIGNAETIFTEVYYESN